MNRCFYSTIKNEMTETTIGEKIMKKTTIRCLVLSMMMIVSMSSIVLGTTNNVSADNATINTSNTMGNTTVDVTSNDTSNATVSSTTTEIPVGTAMQTPVSTATQIPVGTAMQTPVSTPIATPKSPGFESVLSAVAFVSTLYIFKKKRL